MYRINVNRSLLMFILLLPLTSFALSSDNTKELIVNAKTASMNRSTGMNSYKGNVIIKQGSTEVRGDQVDTKADKNNKLQEIIIRGFNGHLAHYKTITDEGKPPLVASAHTIKYYPQRHFVILLKDASIEQDKNKIRGEHLEYDITKLILTSSSEPLKGGKRSRTTIIVQPNGDTSITTTPGL